LRKAFSQRDKQVHNSCLSDYGTRHLAELKIKTMYVIIDNSKNIRVCIVLCLTFSLQIFDGKVKSMSLLLDVIRTQQYALLARWLCGFFRTFANSKRRVQIFLPTRLGLILNFFPHQKTKRNCCVLTRVTKPSQITLIYVE
jgi:hypothetical protein